MQKGDTAEQIAELLEEDLSCIQKIYTMVQKSGLDSDVTQICEKVLKDKV